MSMKKMSKVNFINYLFLLSVINGTASTERKISKEAEKRKSICVWKFNSLKE